MAFFKRVGRAVGATLGSLGAQTFRVKGEVVVCPICKGRDFVRATGERVNRPTLMWINLPWLKLDRLSTSLLCTHCTHVLSFGKTPEVFDEEL